MGNSSFINITEQLQSAIQINSNNKSEPNEQECEQLV